MALLFSPPLFCKLFQLDPFSINCKKSRIHTNAVKKGQEKNGDDSVPESVRIAFEKAREYKKANESDSGFKGQRVKTYDNAEDEGNSTVHGEREVKIYTRDGVITRRFTPSEQYFSKSKGLEEEGISQVDFVGYNFSEKKSRRQIPVGPNGTSDFSTSGPLPEVQHIVGDATKLGAKPPAENSVQSDLYTPRVSTWGVYPRPENISKTYGGGKIIQPGDVLESDVERASHEEKTKKLLEKYKIKMGLKVDPNVKEACEKVLEEGNQLMDVGKLIEAIGCFEKITKEMAFQTELHGLAALQWSICLDTLRRTDEAKKMYKKLVLHPNKFVQSKARHFVYSFEAMEILKVPSSYSPQPNFENYFNSLSSDFNNSYFSTKEDKDELLTQSFPYILFLLMPILFVTALATKSL
eukprot:TRINITY_DN1558_c0_g1_i4.p1 TRINITY_DN1558_c0_g1~~TRINITY_DN1558_c0_g1_i4.p1  ORF type:complete len:409 (-),score=95.24 TRINITY_DN1558_c0_g1_i4:415-1641(-)